MTKVEKATFGGFATMLVGALVYQSDFGIPLLVYGSWALWWAIGYQQAALRSPQRRQEFTGAGPGAAVSQVMQLVKCFFGFHPRDAVMIREAIFGDASRHRCRCTLCGADWSCR